jgi:predicted dehydrogenase
MPFYGKFLLGVVGCGRVFERYYLPAILKSNDWKLTAVCEPLSERRQWLRKFYPDLAVFNSITKLLIEPSLDAVIISTTPETHCHLSIKALDAGFHVLVEKPFALNEEEAISMVEASQRNQRQLQVGFNRRFNSYYSELKKKLSLIPHDRIKSVSSKLIINPKNWNTVTSFYGKNSEGRGVFDDVASHQIDLVLWLLEDKVESVRANHSAKRGEVDSEYIKYELKFSKGLIAKCEAGHGPKYAENIEIQLENLKFLAYPTGLHVIHRLPTSLAHFFSRLRTFLHFSIHKFIGKSNVTLKSIEKQLSSFAAALRGETDALLGADAQSGLYSVQTIQACRKSIQSGGSWIILNL